MKIEYYGSDWCKDCQLAKRFFAEHNITPDVEKDPDDPAVKDEMLERNGGRSSIPTIIIDDKTILVEPNREELAEALGVEMAESQDIKKHDVVMVGAGPAALSAAIYTTREDIDTVLLEKGVIGGLAAVTESVENYPGFPDGVGGLELAELLEKQATRFGAKINFGEVQGLERKGDVIRLQTTDGIYEAKAVLVATGSDYKRAGVKGEDELFGRGVHYCATCDGALYRDKHLAVIGGGDSAAQESLFLSKFATVDIYIRKDHWKAQDVLVKKVEANEKINVHFNTEITEIIGEGFKVSEVKLHNNKTNEDSSAKADGVFVFVGLNPNTGFLNGALELDDQQLIKTNDDLETSMKGVFCAGDVRSGATLQIASAVGEGATAALKIREYLED